MNGREEKKDAKMKWAASKTSVCVLSLCTDERMYWSISLSVYICMQVGMCKCVSHSFPFHLSHSMGSSVFLPPAHSVCSYSFAFLLPPKTYTDIFTWTISPWARASDNNFSLIRANIRIARAHLHTHPINGVCNGKRMLVCKTRAYMRSVLDSVAKCSFWKFTHSTQYFSRQASITGNSIHCCTFVRGHTSIDM